MTSTELSLCLASLACSSSSQLLMKAAALAFNKHTQRLAWLSAAGLLQLVSIGFVVIALRTLPVSQLVPFAAGSYLIVPVASIRIFGEVLHRRFWLGASLIFSGILCTQL